MEKIIKLEKEAVTFGFCWENTTQIMAQIQSECVEINEHLTGTKISCNPTDLQEEIGDLLHAVFSLSVFCNFDPQDTLEKALNKLERRLSAVQAIASESGLSNLNGHSFEQCMMIWEQAKNRVG